MAKNKPKPDLQLYNKYTGSNVGLVTEDSATANFISKTVHSRETNNAFNKVPSLKTRIQSWCTWQRILIVSLIVFLVILAVSATVIPIYVMRLLGGIARKPRPTQADPCSIDVIDLADIFTAYRAKCPRKNLKISAQTDESFWRYRGYKY